MADITEGVAMDEDDRGTVCRLMAKATMLLEDAAAMALEGQPSRLAARDYARIGHQLQTAAHDIATVAETATIIASGDDGQGRDPQKPAN